MTIKRMFLYAALIACIPLSLELWDRYKPTPHYEFIMPTNSGVVFDSFPKGHTLPLFYSCCDSDTTKIEIDSFPFEHSHIPKK